MIRKLVYGILYAPLARARLDFNVDNGAQTQAAVEILLVESLQDGADPSDVCCQLASLQELAGYDFSEKNQRRIG